MWYQKFDKYIQDLGFVKNQDHQYVYWKKVNGHFIYVVLYVDDMLLAKNNMDMIKELKLRLSSKFDMKKIKEIFHYWNENHKR